MRSASEIADVSGPPEYFNGLTTMNKGHPLRRMNLISLRVANKMPTANISEPRRGVGYRKLVAWQSVWRRLEAGSQVPLCGLALHAINCQCFQTQQTVDKQFAQIAVASEERFLPSSAVRR